MVIFHCYVKVYQRKSPWNTSDFMIFWQLQGSLLRLQHNTGAAERTTPMADDPDDHAEADHAQALWQPWWDFWVPTSPKGILIGSLSRGSEGAIRSVWGVFMAYSLHIPYDNGKPRTELRMGVSQPSNSVNKMKSDVRSCTFWPSFLSHRSTGFI